jgi:UDP-galactopyranose mutase
MNLWPTSFSVSKNKKEKVMNYPPTNTYNHDLICLSHLRWNFVFQRPQHLMSRFARERRVYFVEEPVFDTDKCALTSVVCPRTGVHVVTPHLSPEANRNQMLQKLLIKFAHSEGIQNPIVWFYTPMATEFFPKEISAAAVVYDCMDELSAFRGAPTELQQLEKELLQRANLVFTGGVSLFEAKRHSHPRVYPFPSGVDILHFVQARNLPGDFAEQKNIPRPRLGYAGVIDERLDLPLIDEIARKRPDWQFVMIGPVVKISPDALPRRANIHWLGIKDYADLPNYFAGWDVGIMPFALNEATRFISPTKTPEYLSAGLPVVSTAIRDVVRPYGELGLARIARSADEFVAAADEVIGMDMGFKWRERADEFLESLSWDSVWGVMNTLIAGALKLRDLHLMNPAAGQARAPRQSPASERLSRLERGSAARV